MYSFGEANLEFSGKRTEMTTPGLSKVYQYLRDRGITEDLIDRLGLLIVPARELIAKARGAPNMFDDPRLAIVFPHQNVQGKPIDWWSSRLVDVSAVPVIATGFAAMVEARKWGKMFCPPQEAPHGYLSPLQDWSTLKEGDSVYIHESCIKAINGARLGYWSIGLNGVWGFTSRKHGVSLVEELRGLPWKALRLNPVIVFDSNAADNWDVKGAISVLAARIHEVTGRRARHLDLPRRESGEHWGFDDYAVALGEGAARKYLDDAAASQEVEISGAELLKIKLNEEVCVVRSLSRIAEQATGTLMTRAAFTDVNYATYTASIEDDKVVNVPRMWLMDERRVEVERLEYSPGSERLVRGEFLNLWRGMGCEPLEGDVGPWLELLDRRIASHELKRWVVQWFAYPLQNLGAKLFSYIHLYGPPGSGKNGLLAPFMKIYGDNAVVIGKDQIDSTFNSVYATRQFVNLDEIHGGNEVGAITISNRIKFLATSPKIPVNKKGEPEYTVRNHLNMVTTSNYSDSVKLDDGDRRACVIQFGRRDDGMGDDFWKRYFHWVDAGGAEALYAYLLRVDMTGFDPAGHAPMTEWKELVTDATRGAMEKWVRDLWEDPDSVLPPIMQGFKVLSPEQLGAAYYPNEPGKNTPGLRNALGQRMQDMGFRRTDQIKVDGRPMRFWIIREKDQEWTNDMVRSAAKRLTKF